MANFQRQLSNSTEPKTATNAIGIPRYEATKRLIRIINKEKNVSHKFGAVFFKGKHFIRIGRIVVRGMV